MLALWGGHPFTLFYKAPFGAVKTGEEVVFHLHLAKCATLLAPRLVIYKADHYDEPHYVPMALERVKMDYNVFSCSFVQETPALLFYCFEAVTGDQVIPIRRKGDFTAKFNLAGRPVLFERHSQGKGP